MKREEMYRKEITSETHLKKIISDYNYILPYETPTWNSELQDARGV